MLIRCVSFTQKKLLWEALEKLAKPVKIDAFELFDDVTGKRVGATYVRMCDILRIVGRVSFLSPDGVREFQVVEGNLNEIREWDATEDGLICNPAAGK